MPAEPKPTPDQYRYAAAHLRAALAHLHLALHYAGPQADGVAMDELAYFTIPDFVEPAYRHCLKMSEEPPC